MAEMQIIKILKQNKTKTKQNHILRQKDMHPILQKTKQKINVYK